MARLFALETKAVFLLTYGFSQHVEMGLVSCQTQHDQVSVRTENAMLDVGIIMLLGALAPDEVEDFVLALARNASIRKNQRQVLP